MALKEHKKTLKQSTIQIAFNDLYKDHKKLLVDTPAKIELRETAHLCNESINHSRLNLEKKILQFNPIIVQMMKLWNEDFK